MSNNFTLIFPVFEEVHLGKDVFLVPYYLGKKYNFSVHIVYPISNTNKNLPKEIRGVKLIPLKSNFIFHYLLKFKSAILFWYLINNAKKIRVLMNFHWTIITFIQVAIYKLLNKKGICYVKLDTSEGDFISLNNSRFRLFNAFIISKFIDKVDLFSCETKKSYINLTTDLNFGSLLKNKLILMPNGFDEEEMKNIDIEEFEYSKKSNIIITVGRIGAVEKNNKMLLDSLENVNLKDWKVFFIGPIDNAFVNVISSFYKNNSDKRNSVFFVGPIYNKKELWDYFNKSKVFILTSLKEGSPIVYTEAKRFRNYVISTEFPAFVDNFLNEDLGCSIPQNNPEELSKIIQDIVDNKRNIDKYNKKHLKGISWSEKVECLNFKI